MGKAVIFDLDGTLADTLEDIAAAVNGALATLGHPARSLGEFRLLVGRGFRNLVTTALPGDRREAALVEELYDMASGLYRRNALVRTRAYDGVPELLAGLAARSIPSAVLSNKPEELARLLVSQLFPAARFAEVLGDGSRYPRKPDPAAALGLARTMGVAPAEVLFLGDSDVDIETARAAGMFAVGAAWGFRGPAELRASGADAVIEAPGELLRFLERDGLTEDPRPR